MSETAALHGLAAEFPTSRLLLAAANQAHEAGYRQMDAYSPFPIEGLAAALGQRRNRVPLLCLIGGLLGGGGGYFMQDYAMATAYPLNIGGRPLHNIPPYIPITFELTILGAALFTAIGMLALNGLPRLHHPVFGAPGFERATSDGFFLCIEACDPLFERRATEAFLTRVGATRIVEAPR